MCYPRPALEGDALDTPTPGPGLVIGRPQRTCCFPYSGMSHGHVTDGPGWPRLLQGESPYLFVLQRTCCCPHSGMSHGHVSDGPRWPRLLRGESPYLLVLRLSYPQSESPYLLLLVLRLMYVRPTLATERMSGGRSRFDGPPPAVPPGSSSRFPRPALGGAADAC